MNKSAQNVGQLNTQTMSCQALWNITVKKMVRSLITPDNIQYVDKVLKLSMWRRRVPFCWFLENTVTYFNVGSKSCAEGIRRSHCLTWKAYLAIHGDFTTLRKLLSYIFKRIKVVTSLFWNIWLQWKCFLNWRSGANCSPRAQTSRFFSFETSTCPEFTFTSTTPIWSLQKTKRACMLTLQNTLKTADIDCMSFVTMQQQI